MEYDDIFQDIEKDQQELDWIYSFLKIIQKSENKIKTFNTIYEISNCLSNDTIKKILAVIGICKITTKDDIKNILRKCSAGQVGHYFAHLIDAGLVKAMTKKRKEYEEYINFWRNIKPTTNKNPMFLIPTNLLTYLTDNMFFLFDDALSPVMASKLSQRSKNFEKFQERFRKRKEKEESVRFELMKEHIATCYTCRKQLTTKDKEKDNIETFKGKTYCKNCFIGMLQRKEISVKDLGVK